MVFRAHHFFFFYFFLSFFKIKAQAPGVIDSIIITPDATICPGAALQIQTHPAFSYRWSPATFLDDPTSPAPTTNASRPIKYYVDALMMGENLVTNGNFSDGNSAFTSSYSYTATNVTESEYFIGNNPRAWNISLDVCSDHTDGAGQMMLVNGSPAAGVIVWSQTINVQPNTDYEFSAWIQSVWTVNPANLAFRANGTLVGNVTGAPATPCSWSQASGIWSSGGNTTVTLTIIDINTLVPGNDFAIDDISFSELIPVRDSISINVIDAFIKTNEDTTVCGGSAVQLDVSQGSLFSWTPASGLSNPSIPNPVATPEFSTVYIVTGIDSHGCPASDTVLINVNALPVIAITNDTTICYGTAVQLNATGGGTYSWTPSVSLNNSSIANPVTTVLVNDATYRVAVTGGNGCISEDSVEVAVRQYPQFAASVSTSTVCAGTEVNLQASGGDVYQWSPLSAFQDPSLANITLSPPVSETYQVNIIETVCQYDTIISLPVTVNPVPNVSITKSNDINCTVPSAVLEASGAESYLWSPAESVSNPTLPRVISNAEATTSYTVTGSNQFGCSSSTTVMVNVDRSGAPRFVVPNAFSPNNDGDNDCFGIQRWGNTTIRQFSIYNRWGALLFQTSDASACWDGTWKGKPQAPGGYVYMIRAETICGEITRKGLITLIR